MHLESRLILFLHDRSVYYFLAFNHVLREISDNPREENGYKKWAILSSILFIDSGKNNNVIIVNKVNLILADDYSKFTVGSFPGMVKEAAVHVTSEKEGTVYTAEIIQLPKLHTKRGSWPSMESLGQ